MSANVAFASVDQARRTVIEPGSTLEPSEAMAWLSRRIAGDVPSIGLSGEHGILAASVVVSRANNVYFAPKLGVVLTEGGAVYRETATEALFFSPDLSALPRPNGNEPEFPEGAIWLPWGGNTNYGHFIIDGLSGVEAIRSTGDRSLLLAPPLQTWQSDLLTQYGEQCTEVPHDLVKVKSAVWSSCMDHFMHWPNATIVRLSERLRSTVRHPKPSKGIYVSRLRLDEDKRQMVNEIELEWALALEGYDVIHPQEMSVQEQAEAFSGAKVVISSAGAQLANVIFMDRGTSVFEICPSNYPGIWTRNICYQLGVKWHCHYFPSPLVTRSGYVFTYQIDIDAFLSFLRNHVDVVA